MEGSTRHWDAAPDEMIRALAELDRVVDQGVGRQEGVRPAEQGEGDSFVAAFARASQALSCALEIQLALRRAGDPLRLRIGMHTGEVRQRDGGRYAGTEVNRCARIRDTAHGGQTVLSRATHDLVLGNLPAQASLEDLGSHRLRDLQRAEQIFGWSTPSWPRSSRPCDPSTPSPTTCPCSSPASWGGPANWPRWRSCCRGTVWSR